MKNRNTKYDIIYTLMLIFSAVMVAWPVWQYKGPDMTEDFFGHATVYKAGWQDASGKEVNIDKLNRIEGTEQGKEFSIFNTIPDTVREGDAVCFRSKNIFFQVYIDGQLKYDPYIPENPVYTNSYGTDWNFIQIPSAAAGKQIEVRVTYVYNGSRACMDNICIAKPGGAILRMIGSKIVAFVTCVLLLFVGALVIVADIPINMGSRKNHELRYLGLFSISIAIWCLSETNLIQFFMGDNRLMQVVSCSSLMLIPIPIILYLDSAFGFRRKLLVFGVCMMSALQFVICWGLHLSGVADIHETLSLTHLMLAITAAILLYAIVRNYIVTRKNQKRSIYRILRTIGLSGISVATAADIFRFYKGNGSDSAMFVRIGILLFIICFGSSSLEQTINAVKLGIKSEFVAQLAYRDGLTQIGNRTSFEEHLVDLEKIKDNLDAVGIVMFDVNDLKYVNDNMGHHYGDDMLVKSAELIQTAFEDVDAECFRIGGDEFAVLLSGDHVRDRYDKSIVRFLEGMEQYNQLPDKEFRISIAYGLAVYNVESRGSKLMDIYQQADLEMYHKKKEIKAGQIPPEEYYKKRKGHG